MAASAVEFSGGDKLRSHLADIRKKVGGKTTLSVGYFGDATEDNGVSTALVAFLNEFGGSVQVPARTQTIHHLINERTRTFLRNGKFVKAAKSNFDRVVQVPAHTITRPPRPSFRRMISLGKSHWGDDLGKIMIAANYDARLSLDQLGEKMSGELVQSITDQVYAPLAKSTIQAKGFSTTLVDSANMKRSVGHEVV